MVGRLEMGFLAGSLRTSEMSAFFLLFGLVIKLSEVALFFFLSLSLKDTGCFRMHGRYCWIPPFSLCLKWTSLWSFALFLIIFTTMTTL